MAKNSFSGYLAFDFHAGVCVCGLFFIYCCSVSQADDLFLQRLYLDMSQKNGVAEGTDRHRYCGTQCLRKLMNDFPANLAQRPLRIASQLTFPSQPVYRNHCTHPEGLPPQNTPSQARRQSTGVCT